MAKCKTCDGAKVVPNPATELANGTTVSAKARGQVTCPDCSGRGEVRPGSKQAEAQRGNRRTGGDD